MIKDWHFRINKQKKKRKQKKHNNIPWRIDTVVFRKFNLFIHSLSSISVLRSWPQQHFGTDVFTKMNCLWTTFPVHVEIEIRMFLGEALLISNWSCFGQIFLYIINSRRDFPFCRFSVSFYLTSFCFLRIQFILCLYRHNIYFPFLHI